MGAGHVMRCLALAQGWKRSGGHAVFVMASSMPALHKRLQDEGLPVIRLDVAAGVAADADRTVQTARQEGAEWVVVDGYQFDADYQRRVKDAGLRLLVIDDYGHASHYAADLVLNQNPHARAEQYARREPGTRLLLGTRFALLREQFRAWQVWHRENPDVARKILITFGGTDPDNSTGRVLDALRGIDLEIRVVVGAAHMQRACLASMVAGLPDATLITDASNMPELMAWADMAVTAGGSTCLELAFMGVPALAFVTASNQVESVSALDARGAVIDMGRSEALSAPRLQETVVALAGDSQRRSAMSRSGRELVDGFGSERVAMHLRHERVWLSDASMDDAQLLWTWANDPGTRAVSFNSDLIPWEVHLAWMKRRLADSAALSYIARDPDDRPVGYVRFDNAAGTVTVSIAVDAGLRGQGLGLDILRQGCRRAFSRGNVDQVHAFIKPDNTASLRLFARAGFVLSGNTEVRGLPAQQWVLNRSRA
jgi:UDP-2,4-diacetamido-2,4,6-trideoxy-beta-L-altropyranose hydrolase